ncbi:GspE family protein (plasmid) [Citricoccus nitrophenolicus]
MTAEAPTRPPLSPWGDDTSSYVLGADLDGETAAVHLPRTRGLIVTGPVGSGKTVAVRHLVDAALGFGHAVCIADPVLHGAEYWDVLSKATDVAVNAKATAGLIEGIRAELQNRVALLADAGATGIRQLEVQDQPQRILLVVDGYAHHLEVSSQVQELADELVEHQDTGILLVVTGHEIGGDVLEAGLANLTFVPRGEPGYAVFEPEPFVSYPIQLPPPSPPIDW